MIRSGYSNQQIYYHHILSNHFSIVWHEWLLFKLRRIGIAGSLLSWSRGYLDQRHQRVGGGGGGDLTSGLSNYRPCHSFLHPPDRIRRECMVAFAYMCIHVCLVWFVFPTAFIVPHHLLVYQHTLTVQAITLHLDLEWERNKVHPRWKIEPGLTDRQSNALCTALHIRELY